MSGTLLRGIDPGHTDQMAELTRHMRGQELRTLRQTAATPARRGPARLLRPAVGSCSGRACPSLAGLPGQQVMVTSPSVSSLRLVFCPICAPEFTVTGTFDTGMYECDAKLALMSTPGPRLFRLGDTVHGIEVKVDSIYRVAKVAEAIRGVLGPAFWTRDWMQMNASLFAALRQERC